MGRLTPELLAKYTFDWETLDVIIGGQSAIDSEQSLNIKTTEQAIRFLDCYGYNMENPIEKAELFGNFQEALNIIRRYFLYPENPDGLKLEIPRKLQELTDPVQLLIMASQQQTPGSQIHLWACAIMKVMHTISHMDKDLRTNYFTDVQKQILDRVYKYIHNVDGQIFLGRELRDPGRVDLVLFESKPKKSRDSVILKLLHKPENVAEDIFDRVGMRFVTKTRVDALRVVKFLKDRYVIMPANIKPSRSRNTLVNTSYFKNELKKLLSEAESGNVELQDLDKMLAEVCAQEPREKNKDKENPHSSEKYRAIQFTGRQLIKIQNPLYEDLKQLKSGAKGKAVPEDVGRLIERIDMGHLQKEIRFFYPFEVQVADEKSHQENIAGASAHNSYKKNQIQAAMQRVLRGLM